MRRPVLAVLALLASSCKPIETAHSDPHKYPAKRSDLTVRWIGTSSPRPAIWISTADDGESNGRYEGLHALIDPGSPADVESIVLPFLAAHGLAKGASVAYVLST